MKLIEVLDLYPEMCKVGPVARRWPNTRLSYLIFFYMNLNVTFRKRREGVSEKRQKDVIKDQIDL